MFGDCDPEGIVYTPRFSSFALEATHDAMQTLFGAPSIRTLKEMGVLTPVRAFHLEFLAPVTWDDELKMEVRVSDIREHSFSFMVEGFNNSKAPANREVARGPEILAFTASITYVTVSSHEKHKVRIPEVLESRLKTIFLRA